MKTESKRFTILKTKGFLDFETFKIGQTFVQKLVGNNELLVPDFYYAIHVPLRESLGLFLQIPGLFQQILQYMHKLSKESHVISNVIQADLWLKQYSEKFTDCIVLPLYVYYDEIEVGNR